MANKTLIISLVMLSATIGLKAVTVTWDGGGTDNRWTTAANWSNDALPGNGDTVIISNGDTVDTFGLSGDSLPLGTINLSGNSTLTQSSGAVRLNGATINVGAGSRLTGNFWDLNNGTLSFDDGAVADMVHWEHKGMNSFNFNLSATGFTALTPNTLRFGGRSTATSAEYMSQATYNVDMANYTGEARTIVLANFSSFAGHNGGTATSLTDADFQNATLNILNAGTFSGSSLQWNETTNAIELVVAVPEPSSYALFTAFVALGAIILRRRYR